MTSLDQFVTAVIASPSQYTELDRIYVHNRVLGLVGEGDPIAAARNQRQDGYPLCQLCMQNEGYLGRLGYPARSNHRIIRLTLGGWSQS